MTRSPSLNRECKQASLAILLIAAVSTSLGQTRPARAQTPATPVQRRATKASSQPEEDRLRIRLQLQPHDAAAHKRLIDLLQKKGAFRAMVVEDAAWVRNNPTDSFALIELVSYSTVGLHDPEFAIAQLRSYLANVSRKDDPEDYDNFKDQLAGKLVERGRPGEALPLLADLVRLNPNEAGFWADYGWALSASGQYANAIQALRHSIDLDSSWEVTHDDLAKTYLESGDLRGAETEYRAALSVYDAEFKKGESTNSAHSLIRQMVKIEAASHEENALAETHLELAHVLLLEKKYDEAVAQSQAALDADKYEFIALYLRAEIYDAEGDHNQASKTREMAGAAIEKEAASEFSKATEKKRPQVDPRAIFLTDTLWNGESGYPALPSEIVSILEPRPASLSAPERVMLATAYFALGRVPEAKQQWEKAIAKDSTADNAVSHANLGRELLKAGDASDALAHLRRAYELDPENVTYRMDYESATRRLRK